MIPVSVCFSSASVVLGRFAGCLLAAPVFLKNNFTLHKKLAVPTGPNFYKVIILLRAARPLLRSEGPNH